ncbi:class I lanthipeptide [Pseudoalteromonas sp. XMcav2-N]|uniref:class I lanthipeptide n=1 Tax=Pseudoalteromonas sp. XMcav2-N TaxID=2954498 RepID=UPI0034318931
MKKNPNLTLRKRSLKKLTDEQSKSIAGGTGTAKPGGPHYAKISPPPLTTQCSL